MTSIAVEAIWYAGPTTGGREARAHVKDGSVDLLPAQVSKVLAAIKARGGTVTRTQKFTVTPKPAPVADALAAARARDRAYHVWALANESRYHYSELLSGPHARSMAFANPRKLDQWTDCSGYCEESNRDSGFASPSGTAYRVMGNSTMFTDYLPHIAQAALCVSDIVTFGPGGSHHAAKVYAIDEHGITLVSHGGEYGPLLVTLESEHRAQGNGEIYYLANRRLAA